MEGDWSVPWAKFMDLKLLHHDVRSPVPAGPHLRPKLVRSRNSAPLRSFQSDLVAPFLNSTSLPAERLVPCTWKATPNWKLKPLLELDELMVNPCLRLTNAEEYLVTINPQ